uniref:SAM domain-containing protein n=1 Tax=Tetranychus urticae TaxID=32264 RepID=T1K3D5_TETUR
MDNTPDIVAIPAGYEDPGRDYFESDDENDLDHIVYPESGKKITFEGTPEFENIEGDDDQAAKDDSSTGECYVTELEYFLGEINLKDYIDFFKKQRISYNDLISFNETDLDALDIHEYGVKLKIWEAIKKEHKGNWQPSRISYLQQKSRINCADVVIMLRNMENHLRSMQSTFHYLRNHLKNDPNMVSRYIEVANMNDIIASSKDTYAQGVSLMATMKSFVQDVTFEEVTSNGYGKGSMKSKQKKPIPYKTVFLISGLFGVFTTMTYLNRESIFSLFSRK